MMKQNILQPTAPIRTGIDRTETMLMTFLGTGFSILSLDILLGFLTGSVGNVIPMLARWLPHIEAILGHATMLGVCIGAAVAGLVLAICRDRQIGSAARWKKFDYWTTAIIRYFLAYVFLTYGFAKIFHDQFYTPLSVLDTRLGDVSGYSLAWHFFGYSYAYTLFVAFSQILCSLLFFFRRTTTLGAVILVPIISNIVFVNFAYGVPVKLMSSIYLLMALFLLLPEWRRFKALFWDNAPIGAPTFAVASFRMNAGLTVLKTVVILVLIVMPITESRHTYADAMKTTTPLAGTWAVEQYKVNGQVQPASEPSTWKKLYVDSDTMVEIRSGTPEATRFSSTLNDARHTMTIRRISKRPFFSRSYTYTLSPNGTLTISGQDSKHARIEATLTRVKSAH